MRSSGGKVIAVDFGRRGDISAEDEAEMFVALATSRGFDGEYPDRPRSILLLQSAFHVASAWELTRSGRRFAEETHERPFSPPVAVALVMSARLKSGSLLDTAVTAVYDDLRALRDPDDGIRFRNIAMVPALGVRFFPAVDALQALQAEAPELKERCVRDVMLLSRGIVSAGDLHWAQLMCDWE